MFSHAFGASADSGRRGLCFISLGCEFTSTGPLSAHPVRPGLRGVVLQQGFIAASVKCARFLHELLRLQVLQSQVRAPNSCEGRS